MKRRGGDKIVLVWATSEDEKSYELRERGDEDNPCALARVYISQDEFKDGWKYAVFRRNPDDINKGATSQGYGSTASSAVAMAEVGCHAQNFRSMEVIFRREALEHSLRTNQRYQQPTKIARRLPRK